MKSIGGSFRCIRPCLVALTLAITWPAAADATARKCSEGTPLLMVNGVVAGDIRTNSDLGGRFWYSTPAGRVTVFLDQIEFMEITCVAQKVDGKWVARTAVSVGTRDGVEGMLRTYLAELVEVQEGHRRAKGVYASAVDLMDFRLPRHPFDVEMTVVDGGWSASVAPTRASRRACRIAIGTATPEGAASGEVECFDRTEIAASAARGR